MQKEHVGNKKQLLKHLKISFSIRKIPAPVGRMNKRSDSSHATFNYYSQVLGF